MGFVPANQGELVRSSQKDGYFLSNLQFEISEISKDLCGIRWWLKYHKEVQVLIEASYFTLTTLLGNQTLGEEYVNVIQVDETRRRVPRFLKQFLLVLLQTTGPYIIDKMVQRIEMQLQINPNFLKNNPDLKKAVQWIFPVVNQIIDFIHHFHLAIFFFQGCYYHIPKRIVGIQYVLSRNWLEDKSSHWGYRVLGYLSLLQLAISGSFLIHKLFNNKNYKDNLLPKSTESLHPSNKKIPGVQQKHLCHLCLENYQSPTVTQCGHVFCWDCIFNWIENKYQCPICREQITPSRLTALINYE